MHHSFVERGSLENSNEFRAFFSIWDNSYLWSFNNATEHQLPIVNSLFGSASTENCDCFPCYCFHYI
jgi:hypothetical protein